MLLEKVIDLCCAKDPTLNLVQKLKKTGKPEDKTEEVEDTEPEAAQVSRSRPLLKYTDKDTKYGLKVFKDLPIKVKKATETLGYTPEMWDRDESPHGLDEWWEDLPEDKRKAAETVGWDQPSWDHCHEDTDWTDLPACVKKAATDAGFTQEMWAADEWPEALNVSWYDMSSEHQRAMSVLGWHAAKWD